MITGEDIAELERNKVGKKLIVIETMQFFEIEVPITQDVDEFMESEECRKHCASLIEFGFTDLTVDRVLENYDPIKEEWS